MDTISEKERVIQRSLDRSRTPQSKSSTNGRGWGDDSQPKQHIARMAYREPYNKQGLAYLLTTLALELVPPDYFSKLLRTGYSLYSYLSITI